MEHLKHHVHYAQLAHQWGSHQEQFGIQYFARADRSQNDQLVDNLLNFLSRNCPKNNEFTV